MKNYLFVILVLFALPLFAQKEASNWFFGYSAGIKFLDDGTVVPLAGSRMSTNEGCSSMSDSNGNLLFYTDGRSVWDRNHLIMPNAAYLFNRGLLGDPSSTQSGIIVPKKNNPDIYYVFTVDEPQHLNAAFYPERYSGTEQTIPGDDDGYNNGLNYSIVDLSVTGTNGSIGDVTTKNIQLYTYDPNNIDEAKYKCSEKITAVKNSDGSGFWVVTQFIDKFYAFLVNQDGVTETPVVTRIAPIVPVSGYRRNAIGCIKASPDGKYIAIAHQQLGTVTGESENNGVVYLYDFDSATGRLSNATLVVNNINPYGIEFSPEVKKLYVSADTGNRGVVWQYDMLSADIASSGIQVAANSGSTTLQLGPDGKIYRAINGGSALDVINSPEEDGSLCDYQAGAVRLSVGMTSIFGLPPFITSLFSANITANGTCLGTPTTFNLQVNRTFDSVVWDFGDGSPTSTVTEPQHLYANPGDYTVIATVTRNAEAEIVSQVVTITNPAVANPASAVTECETDDNGSTMFDLTATSAVILGSQSTTNFSVRYYASLEDATDAVRALNTTAFINTSNPQTVYARVQSNSNATCYATTSFEVRVGSLPTLGNTTFDICDDAADGNDANGQVTFNLADVTAQLVPNPAGYTISYYATEPAAQAGNTTGTLSQNFYNTTPNEQVVYARIVNNLVPACFSVQPVTLKVNPLPANVQNAVLTQCDTGSSPDGFTNFNLTEADAVFANGNADILVTYYRNTTDAQNEVNVITGAFTNTINPQQISARVSNTVTGCYRILPLELSVSTNVVAPLTLERCDDDGTEDGLAEFDLTTLGLEAPGNEVAYYASENDALMEQGALGSIYTNTVVNTQTIYARIEANNACTALQQIILKVHPLPYIEIADTDIVCLNTHNFITIDAGNPNANFRYLWSNGDTTRTISVNQPGVYTVTVTDVSQPSVPCGKVRTVTVVPGNVATIQDIVVEDLRDNNTVTIVATPTGNVSTTYLYSLDRPNGPWQSEPFFDDVSAGIHTVYVYDANGCGVVRQQVAVLSIPKFFTPNGDLSNDYWRIAGLNGTAYFNSSLYIYDRYGKIITSVDRNGLGWDGTLNGHPLPATDYWYVLTLPEGRVVKGHFSLLR
ncbi:T9SS type B sorting domain-containing protein [Flavobacterium sp. Sd200]|uniref:T9SS type B sorting domain-containing protein n=1 Tax=Flavobacterium sp. Sd200 TaxID=2692211 RepID=UPI001371AA05|nr:T9SS type B sorting domain-containing protein [Flavobacterium sp. Sd200]MXN91538.1 T9SS type B sorting domain-containing protein [Flavobacterium sp. Sd200]